MKVADIVRQIDKGAIPSVALHGKVRGTIKQPKEFSDLVLTSGEWAVLDLYAISSLKENVFDFTDSTLLTPKSSVIFILDDLSLIGECVTVYGATKSNGVDLRRQKSSSPRLGFSAPVFVKTREGWGLKPNIVEPFRKTSSKEINKLFAEYKKHGFYYLDITKSYLGFSGSEFYEFTMDSNPIRSAGVSFTSDLTMPDYSGSLDSLQKLLESARYRLGRFTEGIPQVEPSGYVLNEFFRKIEGTLKNDSSRLIPRTTTRFSSVIPELPEWYKRSYGVFLSELFGFELEEELCTAEYDSYFLHIPHYLYLKKYITFDQAEQIFYISEVIKGSNFKGFDSFYRDIAVLVEGMKRTKKRTGVTLFKNTLLSPLSCKVSENLREFYKTLQTPLPKEVYHLLDYLYEIPSEYSTLFNDSMYLTLSNSDIVLKDAINLGFVVSITEYQSMVTYDLMLETDILDSVINLSNTKYDYDFEDLQPFIEKVQNREGITLSKEHLLSFLNLNTGFGIFAGTSTSGLDLVSEVIYNTGKSKQYFENFYVITKGWGAPDWIEVKDTSHIPIGVLSSMADKAEILPPHSLVFVEQSHLYSLDELCTIFDCVMSGSAVYMFGNPWSGSSYFSTMCSRFPRSVILPNYLDVSARELSLRTVNSNFVISTGKNVKISSVKKLNTVSTVSKLLKKTLDSGIPANDIVVISDLEKSLDFRNVGKKFATVLNPDAKENDFPVGTRVYLPENTYPVYLNKSKKVGNWFGDYFGLVLEVADGVALVSLGNSDYSVTVPVDCLEYGYCLPSRLTEQEPFFVAFVLTQDNRGILYVEDVVRSLDSAKGVSFIGSESVVRDAHVLQTSLKSSLLRSL